jgi:hypothetical protein
LTVYGRQEPREDSPTGWPRYCHVAEWAYKQLSSKRIKIISVNEGVEDPVNTPIVSTLWFVITCR